MVAVLPWYAAMVCLLKQAFTCLIWNFIWPLPVQDTHQVGKHKTGRATTSKSDLTQNACESDNYPRSTEILQINQWAALLILSGQRQIKYIIDLCNPSICNARGWGKEKGEVIQRFTSQQHHLCISSFSASFLSIYPTWLACLLPETIAREGGDIILQLWCISVRLDLAQTKCRAFLISDPLSVSW